jgi:chemotaxis protein methyltransferase CheR
MSLANALPVAAPPLTPECFQFLRDKIHQHSGIVIEQHKQYLLEARLAHILNRRSLRSLNELSSLIRAGADLTLMSEVIESMTTHESYFFRDKPQFDVLRTKIVPELMSRDAGRHKLRFWSAAASSGQEAYTLAMTLQEMQLPNGTFDILATDLSERILARARAATYTNHEIARGLFPEHLKRHFQPAGADWKLRESVTRAVQFKPFDLRQDMRALGTFDVIFCRNVLIYFDTPTKRKIFDGLASVLSPRGTLFLGSTETTLGISERFVRHCAGGAVYYQHAVR